MEGKAHAQDMCKGRCSEAGGVYTLPQLPVVAGRCSRISARQGLWSRQ